MATGAQLLRDSIQNWLLKRLEWEKKVFPGLLTLFLLSNLRTAASGIDSAILLTLNLRAATYSVSLFRENSEIKSFSLAHTTA